jgi:hypothetical protein
LGIAFRVKKSFKTEDSISEQEKAKLIHENFVNNTVGGDIISVHLNTYTLHNVRAYLSSISNKGLLLKTLTGGFVVQK